MGPLLDSIASELAGHGLILRGGFDFDENTPPPAELPPLRFASLTTSPPGRGRGQASGVAGPSAHPLPPGGEVSRRSRDGEGDAAGASDDPSAPFAARSVLLVGQAGAAPWPHFQAWRKTQPAGLQNPLDTWSRKVIGAVAGKFGARAVSPSDRPYLPFQQWAMRAEGLRPSPLGILMHPQYGLWHAWRGALLFDRELDLPSPRAAIHLCDLCIGKPCQKACPVGAYSATGFAYQDCLGHVRGGEGGACRSGGCLDRNACPYGISYRYPAEVQAFHMAAFAG